jgi:hypothetical protein
MKPSDAACRDNLPHSFIRWFVHLSVITSTRLYVYFYVHGSKFIMLSHLLSYRAFFFLSFEGDP